MKHYVLVSLKHRLGIGNKNALSVRRVHSNRNGHGDERLSHTEKLFAFCGFSFFEPVVPVSGHFDLLLRKPVQTFLNNLGDHIQMTVGLLEFCCSEPNRGL